MLFKASAPGSLMLLGEYAVLHGKPALVCAVNKRMSVLLKPRRDTKITIKSDLGVFETDLSKIEITYPFQFVLTALKKFQLHMRYGCDIIITSEFSDKVGFGSSAAVTVATIKAVATWLKIPMPNMLLLKHAKKIIRKVQGLGSGADVAAAVFGGIVYYRMQPIMAEKIHSFYPLSAVYSGFKTPTVEAVNLVKKKYVKHPKLYHQLFKTIGSCAQLGRLAIQQQDWPTFGKIMNIQHDLMYGLGVSSPLLEKITHQLRTADTLGAKISGSGLGDCIIALGQIASFKWKDKKVRNIPLAITEQGVYCEKI
jgi:mevalonate kinase